MSRASPILILIAARQLRWANAFHFHSTHAAPSPKVIRSQIQICLRVLGGEKLATTASGYEYLIWMGETYLQGARQAIGLVIDMRAYQGKEGASLLCEVFLPIHFKS